MGTLGTFRSHYNPISGNDILSNFRHSIKIPLKI